MAKKLGLRKVEFRLPREIFKYKQGEEQIKDEGGPLYRIYKLDWAGCVRQYIEDAEFPVKGFPTPEAMWSLNMIKKTFIEAVKIVSMPLFWPAFLIFAVMPHFLKMRVIRKVVSSYNRLSFGVISPHILEDEHLNPVTAELHWWAYSFLWELDVDSFEAERFAECFSTIAEYDNAYRYRLQDIMAEASRKDLIERPVREVLRLVDILISRDVPGVADRLKRMGYILAFLLMFPKFRKAFRVTVEGAQIENFVPDDEDLYWIALRTDYKFQGKTTEQRVADQEALGYKYPKPVNDA